MVVITSDDREVILDAVRKMYTDVARDPGREFHFPTGREACEFEGYPEELLDLLPEQALASYAGVGCPFAAGTIREGEVVLDVGSGAGTDALIASHLVGPDGEVTGLDMTRAMRRLLRRNAERMGVDNVRSVDGNAESVPLPDGSVDAVTSNGVLNLVPDKPKAARELHRVLRPGGRLQLADIVLAEEPSDACRSQPELWAECIVGATREDEYLELFREAGFRDLEVVDRVDYFARSPSEETRELASSLGAEAVVLRGRKP